MDEREREPAAAGDDASPNQRRRVGLGRVVEDRLPKDEASRPGEDAEENGVTEASKESFPASDPPSRH
jgi:hypothetical protein